MRLKVLWVTGVLILAGCGSGPVDHDSPAGEVSILVSSLADLGNQPELFAACFTDDAAPDDDLRAKFQLYSYWPESVDVQGDTAVVDVEVEDFDNDIVGKVKWTAVREADQWKLSDAPLP